MPTYDDPTKEFTNDEEYNTDIQPGLDNPGVRDAIKLINSVYTQKNERDTRNQAINDLFEAGFTIQEPNGPKKINTKMLQQAVWRVFNKIKPLDFTYHGSQAPDWLEDVVTEGMSTVLKIGGYDSSFRDKGSMMLNVLMYGDGFRMIGTKGSKGFPIEYMPITNSNIYINTRANAIRNVNKPATKCAVIFSGSWDEAIDLFPEAATIAGPGKIPRDISNLKETDQTYLQRFRDTNATTEWCYYYDIEHNYYCVFMGAAGTVLEEKFGDEYPFTYEDYDGHDVSFIPISHYYCIPSLEGFYNHGIGDMIYDLVKLYGGIFNQLAQSVEDNVYGLNFVNLPQGESAKFFQKLQMGYEQRAIGLKPYVPIEYSAGSTNQVTVQSASLPSMIDEAQALFNLITNELKRIGIYLDELDQPNNPNGGDKTATEILSEIEQANQFVRQIMEANASETEFELMVTMEFVKKFVTSKDKTPLHITTTIKVEGNEMRPDDLTLGMLRNSLKARHWWVKVNDRTGVIPSATMRRAQFENMLQFVQPGSPQAISILKNVGMLDDVNIDFDQMQQQSQQMAGIAPGQQGAPSAPPGPGSIKQQAMQAQSPEDVASGNIPFRALGH